MGFSFFKGHSTVESKLFVVLGNEVHVKKRCLKNVFRRHCCIEVTKGRSGMNEMHGLGKTQITLKMKSAFTRRPNFKICITKLPSVGVA